MIPTDNYFWLCISNYFQLPLLGSQLYVDRSTSYCLRFERLETRPEDFLLFLKALMVCSDLCFLSGQAACEIFDSAGFKSWKRHRKVEVSESMEHMEPQNRCRHMLSLILYCKWIAAMVDSQMVGSKTVCSLHTFIFYKQLSY